MAPAAAEFRAMGDASEAAAIGQVAHAHCDRGEPERGVHLGRLALAIAAGAEQPYLEMSCHDVLSIAHRRLGDFAAARDHAEQQLRLARSVSQPEGAGRAYANLAETHLAAGRIDEARSAARQSLAAVSGGAFAVIEAQAHLLLAATALRDGDRDAAVEHADTASDLARRTGIVPVLAAALDLRRSVAPG